MIIFPAIDIIDGSAVRLKQGDYSQKTVYHSNPVEIAKKWQVLGAKWLHLIDLDGARSGHMANMKVVENICKNVDINIQLGGGIRRMDDVDRILDCGVNRVILGTSAIKSTEFVTEAIQKYPGRVVIGIDAKDKMVALEGWESVSSVTALELGKQAENWGAAAIIYTDISRDGMLIGPNFQAMEEMLNYVNIPVIASGGVSSDSDIEKLRGIGMDGVIVGKALYENKLTLSFH